MLCVPKVLVVDDDKFFRVALKDALRDRYQVFESADGDEAINLAPEIRPDLILLDIEMPGRNGLDICKTLKKNDLTKSIPIILVTSRTGKKDILIGLHAGADDYLTKPIYLPEVTARIDSHLCSKRYYSGLEHRDLLMLLDLSNAVTVMRNPMNILRMIVQKMAEAVQSSRFSIVSVDSCGELFVKASSDLAADAEIKLEKSRYPEIRIAIESRRAVTINDMRNDPVLEPVRQFIAGLELQSILVVPIIKKENAIGTFLLRTASTSKEGIPTRVFNLCHLAANISANALENAALFESMKTAQELLEEESVRDGLTRLFTHQHFYERLEEEFSRAKRYSEPLSMIFFDVDNFKRINDTYGHSSGDEVLRGIGRVIRQLSRESDVPARYGGEEFAILLPNTHGHGAMEMARRLKSIIRDLNLACINGEMVTISSGVTTLAANEVQSFGQLLRLADKAMYQAKAAGKDCIVSTSQTSCHVLNQDPFADEASGPPV